MTPRYPLYLSSTHRDALYASGLTDETIALAQLETERDPKRIHKILNWAPPGAKSHDLGECLLIPFYEPGATDSFTCRVRPDNPRPPSDTNKKKKPPKYEQAKGSGSAVYFGPRCRADGRLKTASVVIWLEGEKKQLVCEQSGHACVGLTGVDNWHNAALRKETGVWALHPMIERHVIVSGVDHVICFDSDAREKKEVMRGAKRLKSLLYKLGARTVSLALPPSDGAEKNGVDDFYAKALASGRDPVAALNELFATAEAMPRADEELPEVVLDEDESKSIDAAVAALSNVPNLYVRDHRLVRVLLSNQRTKLQGVDRPERTPTIAPVVPATLRELLSNVASILEISGEGESKRVHPPKWLVEGTHARGVWGGVSELVGVTDAPLLLSDGTVISTSGYHEASMMLVKLAPELEGLSVPDVATKRDAEDAAGLLFDLVSDFPFASDADRAAWLAGVLSAVAREAYNGPTPMFLIEANSRASGKSLLAKLISIIVLGRDAGTAGYAHDAAEMSKRITSIALQGDRIVILDNIRGPFGNEPLERAVTTTVWQERVLGLTKMPSFPFRVIIIGTANNPDVRGDFHRRCIPIRLRSQVERPEDRTDFEHDDVAAYALSIRVELLRAALIILRAYIRSERDLTGLRVLGSFTGWRSLVAGAVRYATGVDPLASRAADRSSVQDEVLEALRTLFDAMVSNGICSFATGATARDLLCSMGIDENGQPLAGAYVPALWQAAREELNVIARRREHEREQAAISANRLGTSLRDHRERTVSIDAAGGQKLVRLGFERHRNRTIWWVEDVVAYAQSKIEARRGRRGRRGTSGPNPLPEQIGVADQRISVRMGDTATTATTSTPVGAEEDDFVPICTAEESTSEAAQ